MAERLEIAFDVRDALGYTEELRERAAPVTREEFEAAMHEAVLLLEREIKEATPVGATALLRGSWASEVQSGESALEVIGLVSSPLNYAAPVEFGTRPHFPPIEPLVDWVRAKLDIQDEKDARRVARAIQITIGRRGTKGQNVAGGVAERLLPQLVAILGASAGRIARRLEQRSEQGA